MNRKPITEFSLTKQVLMLCMTLFMLIMSSKATGENKEFLSLAKQYINVDEIELIVEEGIRAVRFECEDEQEYFFIQSNDYVRIDGYQGITNLAVIIDSVGKVSSVTIIESEETPYFIRRIVRAGFLEQLSGRPDAEKPEIVTGATVSCEAIIETVDKAVEIFTEWLEQMQGL